MNFQTSRLASLFSHKNKTINDPYTPTGNFSIIRKNGPRALNLGPLTLNQANLASIDTVLETECLSYSETDFDTCSETDFESCDTSKADDPQNEASSQALAKTSNRKKGAFLKGVFSWVC